MENKQLQKGNEIETHRYNLKNQITKITRVLRELELNTYKSKDTSVRLDSTECEIDTDSLIKFLTKELEVISATEIRLKKEFKEL